MQQDLSLWLGALALLYSCLCSQTPEELVLGRSGDSPCWITSSQDPWISQDCAAPESLQQETQRGLAQFGNPCAACASGQLSFLWEVSCLKEILLVFRLYPFGKGHDQAAAEGSYPCPMRVFPHSKVYVELAWKSFPCLSLKAGSGKLAPPSNLCFCCPCSLDWGFVECIYCAGSSAQLATSCPGSLCGALKGCPHSSRTITALLGTMVCRCE